jgi:3' terminal RNA ribose 2'-O-methyltransferase Hen1
MLLTISTTHVPATDLGFLLHKNPNALRSVELPFGTAHVFYPEASAERCTAALIVEVDPVGLVRARRGPPGSAGLLQQYVNDRPYAASSFTSVALTRVFGTAMGGRSKERQDLADSAIPLQIRVPVLPCRGGEPLLCRLFEPLGYEVHAVQIPLDERFPEWGASRYLDAELRTTARLRDVLTHLYVLLPVLDDEKHYWVGRDELEKLLRRGEEWLAGHPEKELITRRYLRHRGGLTREALARLLDEDQADPDLEREAGDEREAAVEEQVRLRDQRIGAVLAALKAAGARRVLDLGCGDAVLVQALLRDPSIEKVVGMDVSHRALQAAARRLHVDQMSPRQRERVQLLHGSLIYRDRRLEGFDAAAVVEVVEHLDPGRLETFERVLLGHTRPATVVLTTPNAEHNLRFEGLPAGTMRHPDHRFEWTREEFREWAERTATNHGYSVRFLPVGPEDPEVGPPTQMAVLTR